MKMAKIVSVNISTEKGTVKQPVGSGILKENYGLESDAHSGSWHRQLSLLASESYAEMEKHGVTGLKYGTFAENVTTEGIELHTLPVGTKLQLGTCIAEVTQIGKECHQGCEIFKKAGYCVMPKRGIFVRVLKGGKIAAGDEVKITE